jgi:hypothetical protein
MERYMSWHRKSGRGVLLVALLASLLGVGCGDDAPPADAGTPPDGGSVADVGTARDAGLDASGPLDGGADAAGDAGVTLDEGVDSGLAADVGLADAGAADLGVTDAGVADSGMRDQGVDAGPPPGPAQLRIVHAVSDLLTSAGPAVPTIGVRLCIETPFGVIPQPANADLVAELDLRLGLPHRSVSPYTVVYPLSTIRVYDEALVDNDAPGALPPAVNCPVTSDGNQPPPPLITDFDSDCTDDAVPCLFEFEFDPTGLEDGSFSTLLLQGFVDNTDTCGAGLSCPTAAVRADLLPDEDRSHAVANVARVRFIHGVHNVLPADVCYDADGLASAAAAPVAVHSAALPGATTSYASMPALPSGTGMMFLTLKNPADPATLTGPCALSAVPAVNGLPSNVVPVYFSAELAATTDISTHAVGGAVFTIVMTGDSRYTIAPTGSPASNPIDWANYLSRMPLAIVAFEHVL